MPSTKIHDFTAESTNPIYIDYTALNTKVDYTTSKLTVSFKDVKMRLDKGFFNYHIKAFLAVKFFDSAGKFKSFAGNDSVYKVIYNNDTKVYEYTNDDLLENKIPDTSPSKGTSQRTSPWHYFKAPYLIIEKLSETEGGGATAAWNAVTSARDKSFTIDIPSGAASAKLYIMSDSDPYWQYPSNENWQLWCASCPCGSHATNLDDHINKLEEVEILVEPISKGSAIYGTANPDNTFSLTFPSFKSGTNNPIAKQEALVYFRRGDVYTGEYFPMFGINFNFDDEPTKLKFKDSSKTDPSEKYEIDTLSYTDKSIVCTGKYKLKDGSYVSTTESGAGNYYRSVVYDEEIKHISLTTWDVGKNMILEGPITISSINKNIYNQPTIYGASYIWVEAKAHASSQDCFENPGTYGLVSSGDNVFINVTDYKDSFFTNKPFSKDYFHTGWKYDKNFKQVEASDANGMYYIANHNYYSCDIRKNYSLETPCSSYPRAPRELWYESTHKNKTYTNSEKASQIDTSKIYKQDLRPRLKDLLTWRWSGAFGGLRSPRTPKGYRIYLYRKDKDTGASYNVFSSDFSDDPDSAVSGYELATNSNLEEGTSFETAGDYINIQPKKLGFKSGDYCGCKVIAFDSNQLYSTDAQTNPGNYEGLLEKPSNYKVTVDLKEYSITNNDKSLYGDTNSYSTEKVNGVLKYSPDKSFADGGCPSIDPKYNYIESLTDCEVRNGAVVWVKVSDDPNDWAEGTPWVRTADGWKEADSLYVKTETSATGWKESD